MGRDRTPRATKLALVAVLLVTGALVGAALASEPRPRTAGIVLAALTGLFAVRVAGQLVARARAPRFLPPTEDWNLMPYRLLLPIQVAFLAVMTFVWASLLLGAGVAAQPSPGFGRAAIAVAFAYAGPMAVRYAVRMARRPGERWFGGTIPIVFHVVLAGFALIVGSFHASG